MEDIRIGDRLIGDGHPSFIIAEAGANFRVSDDPEENYHQALRLIDIAVEAKADCVKFQLYRAKKLYVKDAGHADYIGKKKEIFDIIKEMELPYEWLPKLKAYCKEKGILFLCAPFDEESVDQLEALGIEAYKIASYSITQYPLLKKIARMKKPVFLSTGASDLEDVKKGVAYLQANGCGPIIVNQCTAKYPAPLSTLNLRTLPVLRKATGCHVGLSDHSREPYTGPLGAVALGAVAIEKHYTTDNSLPGPDHGFAILADELSELVKRVRQMEEALGNSLKEVDASEEELHAFARHYLFATAPIRKGEPFTEENVAALRPGKRKPGLPADEFDKLLGRKAVRDIEAMEALEWEQAE
jgi:sialic acid synthase SpsE